jgi:hypothetical protein
MRRRWAPASLLLLLAAGVSGAQENTFRDELPLYFGASCRNVTVLGQFTGDLFVSDGYQLVVVPEVNAGWGFGGLVGVNYGSFAVEVSSSWSSHEGTWAGSETFQSRLANYGLGIRWFPVHLGSFEPFVLGGCSGYDLTVIGGATDGSVYQDTTFHGIGLDLGAGLRIGIGKHLSLLVQAVYHWARINTVDRFFSGYVTIADGIDASGFDYGALVIVSL